MNIGHGQQVRTACAGVVWCSLVGLAASVRALPENLSITGGFVESDGVLSADAAGEPRLTTKAPLSAGYYVFSAEYKTEGLDPLAKFALDARTPDRSTNLSGYEWVSAVPEWAPLELYFRLPTSLVAQFRVGNWTPTAAGARIHLRNVAVRPFSFAAMDGSNWLASASFDGGQPGFLPPDWYWNGTAGRIDQHSLVPNTTYRSGKYVLRLTGDADKAREIRHRGLPLPDNGDFTFSVWARADNPATLTLHIVQDGWAKRVEKAHKLTTTWQKYTAEWPVPTTREKDWFFLRMDAPAGGEAVEVAEPELVWHASGPVAAIDPFEAARKLGWQGAPGANLLYNPDLELGGTGFFYDFSWPKQYGHYASIRNAKPIELLAGQGVDGGTCAFVQGTSLRPYCFPVTVGQTYTLSADLRAPTGQATAECRVWAFDSEWKCALSARVDKISGDAWKRYNWTFTWKADNIQKRGYVRFDSPGVLVDRIQVVEGGAKDYDAPPVMLGLVFDRWPYFVRGRDAAKAQIKVVPGVHKAGTAQVKAVAKDAWGREVWSRSFEAPLDKEMLLPVDLPTERLGVFHLDLTATVGGTAAGIGIGRYAILDPAALQPAVAGRPRLAGICQESFNFPVWLCQDHATIQTDIGIRLNRFFASIPPDLPEPLPPEWAADLKAKCKPFREAGIDVMPCVELIPESASKGSQNLDMPRPEDLTAFGEHLRAYVEALKDEVKYWEIFNEPNLWRMASGPDAGKRTMFPLKYLEFQKVAYQTIKAVDPGLHVAAPGLNNVDAEWIDAWMKAGAGAYMDVFSFHPYGVDTFLDTGLQLEKTMQGFGFQGPLVNSEKYYGANLFYDRAGYEETRRGYYLPHDGELKTAGRSIQHFVSSAAVGVPVCFFNPEGTLSRRGPASELFLYDFFAAYNAAIRMVVDAGRGERVEMGPSVSAILFPQAKGGPLVALWTPLLNIEGGLRIDATFATFDIMGNAVNAADVRTNGVRIATDPSYVRFPAGTSAETARAALTRAEPRGMGDPFQVELSATGSHQLTAWVTSLRNRPLDGQVRLANLPAAWGTAPVQPIKALPSGQTVRVDFPLPGTTFQDFQEYPVSVVAESGEEFVRRDCVLRPLFARPLGPIQADGDLKEWAGATWWTLGDGQLSKDFGPARRRNGAADLSARVAVGWSAEAFCLTVVVTDDRHQPGESAMLGWQGDSLQIYFDPRNDATSEARNAGDDVEYLCSLIGEAKSAWLVKGAEGNFKGEANKSENLNDGDVQLAIVRRDGETVYELQFPRRACLPGATLTADSSLGFALLINDNDGEGRKVGLTLTPKGTEPYGASHLYRDLILSAP